MLLKEINKILDEKVRASIKKIDANSKVNLEGLTKKITDFSGANNTLNEVEELLDPKQFYRANCQFIINVDAMQSVKPVENAKLIIRLKEPNQKLDIDMSRLKSPEFKKWLDR